MSDEVQEIAQQIATELHVNRSVSLLQVEGNVSPFLWVTRTGAKVILPRDLISRLESASLCLIIRHELMHFVRRDYWANLFSTAVVSLMWWNPVAWWARRELAVVQE